MKRVLPFFITFSSLIPCLAQRADVQTNERPSSGCAGIPVMIMELPESQSICPGSEVSFTAFAVNVSNRTWQMSTDSGRTWSPSIGMLRSAINDNRYYDTLTIPVVNQQMNGYMFRCNYSGCSGTSYITPAATLTVAAAPTSIAGHPTNVSTCKYTSAAFEVRATGSSLTYQWQASTNGGADFTNMLGETASILHFDSVTNQMNNYRYRCLVNSECNPLVISSSALLTVLNESTSILTQPSDQTICAGSMATFSTLAQGNNMSYQWQKYFYQAAAFEDLPGADSPSFSIVNAPVGTTYRCKISSTCYSVYTNSVQVRITPVPVFASPEVKNLCTGEQAVFSSIPYYNGSDFAFQWQVSSDSGITYSDISNEISNYLSITVSPSVNGYRYRCRTSNNCVDSFSNTHTLYNVYIPLVITQQPADKNMCVDATGGFSVNTTGRISSYRWEVSTDGGQHFVPATGGYNFFLADMVLNRVDLQMDNNLYRCKIISLCGDTVYSNVATLHVYSNPDLGNNVSTTVDCDTCTVDVSGLYDVAGFAQTSWNPTNTMSAKRGKYKLKVTNTGGCSDSAFIFVNMKTDDTIRICKGAPVSFATAVTGVSYQWEWDYGLGFQQLYNSLPGDDLWISGATGPLLTISSLNFSGRVRCKVNNSTYNNPINFILTAYWLGNENNAWENPANWSCGEVPNFQTEVIIMEGARFTPEINTNAACKKLFMKKNASINVNANRNLNIGLNEW